MKLIKKLLTICMAALFAALTLIPATLAYNYHVTRPYGAYFDGGIPRIGAYSSTWGYGQGMYNYVSPPIGLTRYGAAYHWGSNVRWQLYPQYPSLMAPGHFRPYYGYPYASFGSPYWEHYKYYGTGR